MATPTPAKTPTPQVPPRQQYEQRLRDAGYTHQPDDTWTHPSDPVARRVTVTGIVAVPQATATAKPQVAPEVRTAYNKYETQIGKPGTEPSGLNEQQYREMGAVRAGNHLLVPQNDGSLDVMVKEAKTGKWTKASDYSANQVADLFLKQLFPDRPDLLKLDSDQWPKDVKQQMDEVQGAVPTALAPAVGAAPDLGSNQSQISPPGGLDAPPEVTPEEVAQLTAMDKARPSTSAQRQPSPATTTPPAPTFQSGYHTWQNPSGQTGGSSNQYYLDKSGTYRSVGGGGGIATGPSTNYSYTYGPGSGSSGGGIPGYGAGSYYIDPNDPSNYSGDWWNNDPNVQVGYAPPGYAEGGRTVVPEPSIILGRSGKVYGTIGELRPEGLFPHQDGSTGIENHVTGMPRYATGGTINSAYGPSYGGASYQSYIDQGQTPDAALANFSPGTSAYMAALNDFNAAKNTTVVPGSSNPQASGTPSIYDPNNPQASSTPVMGGTSGGYSGLSFPGTTIGGYSLPGLNTGSLPGSSLPWNGTGPIPTGLDVNNLETQGGNTLSSLLNYKSAFDTGLQNVYSGINNARTDLTAKEQAAMANEPARLGLQHLRDTFDPYYSRAGMARPAEVNPGLGDFDIHNDSPGGVGLRYALLSPAETAARVEKPLSDYEAQIGRTAAGVQTQISDAQERARNILSFLRQVNPSKTNPYGAGLVPGNQYPTGANLTPQQEADDQAALIRAQESLDQGQTGTIKLPSGITVTYRGSKSGTGGGGSPGGGGYRPPAVRTPNPPVQGSMENLPLASVTVGADGSVVGFNKNGGSKYLSPVEVSKYKSLGVGTHQI